MNVYKKTPKLHAAHMCRRLNLTLTNHFYTFDFVAILMFPHLVVFYALVNVLTSKTGQSSSFLSFFLALRMKYKRSLRLPRAA